MCIYITNKINALQNKPDTLHKKPNKIKIINWALKC